jgi:hypothetical protein
MMVPCIQHSKIAQNPAEKAKANKNGNANAGMCQRNPSTDDTYDKNS